MRGDKLTISRDDSERFVWLVIDSPPQSHREGIWLREGFDAADVVAAIEATGWAQVEGDGWRMVSDIRCEPLRIVVEEMMYRYFTASGVPTLELLTVRSALADCAPEHSGIDDIPLLACAWLDVMVRDDIADAARSVKTVWSNRTITIDGESHCERRAKELLARFSSVRHPLAGKMAPSKATRTDDSSRTVRGA